MNKGIRDVIRQLEMSMPIDYDILPVYTEYGLVGQWRADRLVSEGKLRWCKG